jgi:hypothetical protein
MERRLKYFTEGWYEFKKANGLREGDKLKFQLSDPQDVVVGCLSRTCNEATDVVLVYYMYGN